MNYYDVLEVSKDSSQEEIKKSFRSLAMKFHPDMGSGDSEKFKEINKAYETLSDPDKRKTYDFSISKNNSSFVSNNYKTTMKYKGADVSIRLNVGIESIYCGAVVKIRYPRVISCDKCKGIGSKSGKKSMCQGCNGTGTAYLNILTMHVQSICASCHGEGSYVPNEDRCDACRGSGLSPFEFEHNVDIPRGINTFQGVRVAGLGNQGRNNGYFGDLVVFLSVEENDTYRREGDALVINQKVMFYDAILGNEINVKLPGGTNVKVNCPKFCKNKQEIIVKNAGFLKDDKTSQGDAKIIVNINIPDTLDDNNIERVLEIKKSLDKGEKTC